MIRFDTFCGYDLRTGCRMIAPITAGISILMAFFFFYSLVHGISDLKDPDFGTIGSIQSFATCTAIIATKQITHLFFCLMLFNGSKSDNVYGIRSWLKSNLLGICILSVLGSYCTVLLFVSGSIAFAVANIFVLLIVVPTKIYFSLVVNSYHNTLAPDHIWGSTMRIDDNVYPRSCHTVPRILVNQPTAVNITV